jgi:hypothetical protein
MIQSSGKKYTYDYKFYYKRYFSGRAASRDTEDKVWGRP